MDKDLLCTILPAIMQNACDAQVRRFAFTIEKFEGAYNITIKIDDRIILRAVSDLVLRYAKLAVIEPIVKGMLTELLGPEKE
jgi:hypothetical protein